MFIPGHTTEKVGGLVDSGVQTRAPVLRSDLQKTKISHRSVRSLCTENPCEWYVTYHISSTLTALHAGFLLRRSRTAPDKKSENQQDADPELTTIGRPDLRTFDCLCTWVRYGRA